MADKIKLHELLWVEVSHPNGVVFKADTPIAIVQIRVEKQYDIPIVKMYIGIKRGNAIINHNRNAVYNDTERTLLARYEDLQNGLDNIRPITLYETKVEEIRKLLQQNI